MWGARACVCMLGLKGSVVEVFHIPSLLAGSSGDFSNFVFPWLVFFSEDLVFVACKVAKSVVDFSSTGLRDMSKVHDYSFLSSFVLFFGLCFFC